MAKKKFGLQKLGCVFKSYEDVDKKFKEAQRQKPKKL
jgi:hypothetical protein